MEIEIGVTTKYNGFNITTANETEDPVFHSSTRVKDSDTIIFVTIGR